MDKYTTATCIHDKFYEMYSDKIYNYNIIETCYKTYTKEVHL